MTEGRGYLTRWLFTTNHKDIGILYLITALYFMVVGGILALTFRIQLTFPNMSFLSADSYNQAVTLHGLLMVLWFTTPLAAAFANYFVPIQIGARDMAFPRLNALSYWLYLASGILALSSFFAPGGTLDTGWTLYAPLNTLRYSPAAGGSLMGLAVVLLMASSIVATVNFLTTIFRLRAPGLKLTHLPMFTLGWLFTVFLMLWAFPAFLAPLILLVADRVLGTVFYTAPEGGALLWDHLFWFFGHPEVYILVLPGLTAAADILVVFSKKPFYGKKMVIVALTAASILSYVVYVHHMFMTGIHAGLREFFNITTELISIPFGVFVIACILTLVRGKIRFTTPMLFALGAIFLFIVGGASGVFNSSVALNFGLRGTFWVVAHFHYTIVGGAITGLIAALYYWFPKMTGRMYSERLGKIHFVWYMIGFNLLYFPMHLLFDMPRRIYFYGPETGWALPNLVASIGSWVFGLSFILLFINLLRSLVSGPPAGPDPWGGFSLEWKVPSPPPEYNFPEGTIPVVTPEGVRFQRLMANGGTHAHAGNHQSPWPFLLSVGTCLGLLGLIFGTPLLIQGLALFILSIMGWAWDDIRGKFKVALEAIGEKWPFDKIDNVNTGMWFFLFGEVGLFGPLFGAYMFIRLNSQITGFAWPLPGQVHDIFLGAFNTILLVTSGLAMALAVLSARQGNAAGVKAGLVSSFLLGLAFIFVKGFEWSELFNEGITFSTDIASSLYFVMTGVHGAHVIAGLLAMVYFIVKAFKVGIVRGDHYGLEALGLYWGFVDAVWLFLYPVFYLI